MTLFLWAMLMALFLLRSAAAPLSLSGPAMSEMPLYILLGYLTAAMPVYMVNITVVLLAFLTGVVITRIMVRNMILQERTYLSSVIFIVVAFGTYLGSDIIAGMVLAILLVSSCDLMLSSFRRELILGGLFNSAFLVGIAILLYAPAVVYLPVLVCGMVVFRKTWRGWLVTMVGVVTPFLICSYVYWGIGYDITYIAEAIMGGICAKFVAGSFHGLLRDPFLLPFWASIAVTTVISVIGFLGGSAFIRTRPYKSYIYYIWILLFTIPLLVAPGRSVMDFFMMAVPLSVLISAYLGRSMTRLSSIIYIVLIASVIVYNVAPLISVFM